MFSARDGSRFNSCEVTTCTVLIWRLGYRGVVLIGPNIIEILIVEICRNFRAVTLLVFPGTPSCRTDMRTCHQR
jgi:hypothetical protein